MKKLLKVVYCAPRKAEVVLEVTAHHEAANTVDLAGVPGKDPETGAAIVGAPLTGVPLVADSVAGCALKHAFARPHTWSKPEPAPETEAAPSGKKVK